MILRWDTMKNTCLIFLNKPSDQKLSPLRGYVVGILFSTEVLPLRGFIYY
jgi:hypothetical protein